MKNLNLFKEKNRMSLIIILTDSAIYWLCNKSALLSIFLISQFACFFALSRVFPPLPHPAPWIFIFTPPRWKTLRLHIPVPCLPGLLGLQGLPNEGGP